MTLYSRLRSRRIADERGASLVVVVMLLPVLILFAALAIDTANWFAHHSHLQTQADAAALAAAQDFQFPCTSATDEQIATDVHHYDGTQSGAGNYNQQIPSPPAHGGVSHEFISLINAPNFAEQSTPGDSISSSPCTARQIDVKVTETNVPWYLSLLNVGFINAQARVTIEQQSQASGNEPLAIPSPAPTTMSATLINESNGSKLAGPVSLSPDSSGTTWNGNTGNVTFPTPGTIPGSVPVGLRVAMGQGPSCGSQLQCYDSGSANGIVYTRAWSVSGAPGAGSPAVPPQAEDVTLEPTLSGGCPLTNGTFSGFIASSSPCSVQLSPTVLFAPGAVCGTTPNVELTLTVNGQHPAMTCNSATVQTTAPCTSTTPCVKTMWSSAAVPAGTAIPDGPFSFALDWTQKFGTKPSGASGGTQGACGTGATGQPKTCTGTFGTVQRAFNGAYSQTSANSSRSGPIIGATLADTANGNALTSIRSGTQKTLAITVNILNLGFQNATSTEAGNPVVLHTGGNQGTYAIQCGQGNGASLFTTEMASGCQQAFATTTQPNPPICSNQPPGPAVCANQNPGGGKVIEPGIDQRVNGSSSAPKCVGPNYWTSQNTLYQIEHQNPPDPRLVQLIIVDSGAWVGVSGASFETPVRAFSTFYITGWSGPTATPTSKGGDPCFNQPDAASSNGLSYTHDDNPGSTSNVLLGHFIKYVDADPSGGGTGLCDPSIFGNCIAVLTK
jgi:Putative Flp pilus-assembly TadE/G-like